MISVPLADPSVNKLPNRSFKREYHCWCEESFGPHAVKWWNYNDVFFFAEETDFIMFMLKWS